MSDAPPFEVSFERSTVTIGGRTFPAVGVVCPDSGSGESEFARNLSVRPTGAADGAWVPAENGVIFLISNLRDGLVNLSACSATCELCDPHDDPMWLPITLELVDGVRFEPYVARWREGRTLEWRMAEPAWVAEAIVRWSRLPVAHVEGPQASLVPLADLLADATSGRAAAVRQGEDE